MKENEQILKIVKVKEITGYGVMECRKALKRTDWDIQNAVKYLCHASENPIRIGLVREIYNNDKFPSIYDLINKPIKEKNRILEYMKQSKIDAVTAGSFIDLIDNKTKIYAYSITDGKYSWGSDTVYYLEKYDMELPEEFVQHALSHL
jgi:hypothetical protein